jgi:hypothetical protein
MGEASPTDRERLRAVLAHADQTVRYYATAYLREDEGDRQLMSAYMAIAANVIALIEGDRLDDRGMLESREKIIHRYLEQAKSDPFEPGNCSFCGTRPVVAWFEGPTFTTFVRRSTDVRAEEAWLACATCLSLVEADDRDALARRGAERLRRRRPTDVDRHVAEKIERDHQKKVFWQPRDQA